MQLQISDTRDGLIRSSAKTRQTHTSWRGIARLARLCQGHVALKQHLAEQSTWAITKAAAAAIDRLTDELGETD